MANRGRGVRRVRHAYRAWTGEPLPKGFRAIVLYSIIIGLCYLFLLFIGAYNPALFAIAQMNGKLFWGFNLVVVLLIASIVYGISARKPWAYPIAVFWFAASILLSLFSVFMVDQGMLPAMRALLWVMAIAVIAIDLLVLWYLTNRKSYLLRPQAAVPAFRNEQLFVRILGCCWIALILISAGLGMNFYTHATTMADQSVEELTDTTIIHALVLCDTKEGQERDICYVVMATMFPDQDLDAICSRIDAEFFRFTCYQTR